MTTNDRYPVWSTGISEGPGLVEGHEIRTINLPVVEIRAEGEERKRVIAGYAAVFNQRSQPMPIDPARLENGVVRTLVTKHTYDAKGRVTSTTDPLGNVTRTEYDLIGKVVDA